MNFLTFLTFFLLLMSFIPYITNIITFTRNGTSIKDESDGGIEEWNSWNEILNRCGARQRSMFSGNISLLTSINHYEQLNVSTECPRRYKTCTGESSIINLCSVALGGIPNCDCSEDCYKFSSCCIDFPINNDSLNNVINDVVELNSCQYSRTFPDKGWPFIMRTKCSSKWLSDRSWDGFNEIRDGCERKNSSDFFRQVLVTSRDTGVTYQNIFCLVCNFDLKDLNDIIFWPSTISCDTMNPNSTEVATTSSAQVTDFIMNDTSNCTLRNYMPINEEISLKPCYDPNVVVQTCRKNWLRSSRDYRVATLIQRLCHSIHAPVIMIRNSFVPGYEDVLFFRNKFCAACQEVALKDLFCLDHFLPSRNVIHRSKQEPGHPVMTIGMKMNDEESAFKECNSREMMWDPFGNVCRKVFCKVGFDFCSPSSSPLSLKTTLHPSLKCNIYSIQVIVPFYSILLLYFSSYTYAILF